jgi:hypothetical protein
MVVHICMLFVVLFIWFAVCSVRFDNLEPIAHFSKLYAGVYCVNVRVVIVVCVFLMQLLLLVIGYVLCDVKFRVWRIFLTKNCISKERKGVKRTKVHTHISILELSLSHYEESVYY